MSQKYSSVLLGIIYVALREKHFPQYQNSNFKPDDFVELARLLEKEKLHPQRYMEFVLGILNTTTPTSGKNLADPVLIAKYRAMTSDQLD